MIHAIRVELIVRYLMSEIVPPEEREPFLYWLRFEWGHGGNPHAHGKCYVPKNPDFDAVVKDEATLRALFAEIKDHPDTGRLHTKDDAENMVANFFDKYVKETHPAKDPAGNELYPFLIENLKTPSMSKPQTINLLEVLEDIFREDEPDLSKLNEICLALIENGKLLKLIENNFTYQIENIKTI